MRLLLDTHALLWWLGGGEELSKRARSAVASSGDDCLVSIASCWEIAIKLSLGRLRLKTPIERFLPEQMAENGFAILGIDLSHVARAASPPFHHRDPFDRLLAAQALEEGLALVSADPVFVKYGVRRIW